MGAKLVPVRRHDTRELYGYRFDCPGCSSPHTVGTGWAFNGSLERPTFTPSILVTWNGDPDGPGGPHPPARCHSFITDGRIAFGSDCTHALAGQTVDLPDIATPPEAA